MSPPGKRQDIEGKPWACKMQAVPHPHGGLARHQLVAEGTFQGCILAQGFSTSTVDILNWIIGEGCPVYHRMVRGIPGLYPLDAKSTPIPV